MTIKREEILITIALGLALGLAPRVWSGDLEAEVWKKGKQFDLTDKERSDTAVLQVLKEIGGSEDSVKVPTLENISAEPANMGTPAKKALALSAIDKKPLMADVAMLPVNESKTTKSGGTKSKLDYELVGSLIAAGLFMGGLMLIFFGGLTGIVNPAAGIAMIVLGAGVAMSAHEDSDDQIF